MPCSVVHPSWRDYAAIVLLAVTFGLSERVRDLVRR